jgi:hypothetical protein
LHQLVLLLLLCVLCILYVCLFIYPVCVPFYISCMCAFLYILYVCLFIYPVCVPVYVHDVCMYECMHVNLNMYYLWMKA